MSRLELRIPPPLVGLLVALAMWGASGRLPRFALPAGLRIGLAVTLLIVGALIALAGARAFRRAKTTVSPLDPGKTRVLVTSGIYRFTRNPMYLGLALALVAWAVALASWPVLAGPAVFVLYIGRFQIAPEERTLARLFGDEFERYRTAVGRWF